MEGAPRDREADLVDGLDLAVVLGYFDEADVDVVCGFGGNAGVAHGRQMLARIAGSDNEGPARLPESKTPGRCRPGACKIECVGD